MSETNPITFFDVTLGGEPLGRIKFELFHDVTPRTSENFRQFCTGETKGDKGKPQGYKNTKFHRVIQGFMLQGGDFVKGDGRGSTTIYGPDFMDDENFKLKHDEPFLLSSANQGKNTNGCQFFITTAPTPHLDGKHVIFGKVVEGQDVVRKIEAVRVNTNDNHKPIIDVTVSQCGEM